MKLKLPSRIIVAGGKVNAIGGEKQAQRIYARWIWENIYWEALKQQNGGELCKRCKLPISTFYRRLSLKQKMEIETVCFCTVERKKDIFTNIIEPITLLYGAGMGNATLEKLLEKWKVATGAT